MRRLLVCLVAGFVLSGCVGAMLPGRMYASPNGQVLQFNIQTSRGSGSMNAFNDQSGERFVGEYHAMPLDQGLMIGSVAGRNVALAQVPTRANGKGVLVGDKGTMITLYLDIKPGLRPSGHGSGTDQNNVRYEVFF